MEKIELNVKQRDAKGKSINNQLRREGSVPAVVYRKGKEATSISLNEKEFLMAMRTDAGRNVLIDLKTEGKDKSKTVVVKDIQFHPLTGSALHIDFHQVSMKEKIKVEVPVKEIGEADGVKNEGGNLELVMHQLEVECLPTAIPEHIDVDVTHLKMNQGIHVSEITLPEGVVILNDPETVVAHVVPPHTEELEDETEAEEGAAEPEVISEKKQDDEEGKKEESKKG